MAKLPKIAGLAGQWVELGPGEYRWCSCGLSKSQALCDDKHRGTGMEPVAFSLQRSERIILCMCKHTRTPPYCDGSHARFVKDEGFDEYL
jgi:CDGSH-type Zn-finger protein